MVKHTERCVRCGRFNHELSLENLCPKCFVKFCAEASSAMVYMAVGVILEEPKIAYRYMEDQTCDYGVAVKLFELPILKFTPCGYWIKTNYDNKGKHFVKYSTLKKYAHLNKEDALRSFVERKKKQILVYENQLKIIKHALVVGESMLKKSSKNG
jgi:hypothetical protein